MSESNLPESPAPDAAIPPDHTQPIAKKKRRVPRWLKIVGGFFALIALLVLFAPTIASTGLVRSFAVGKINENLNGRIEIAEWSFGWFSGARMSGVHVRDAGGGDIIQLASLTTELSVLDLFVGNYSVGDAVVDGLVFDIRREADGKLNIEKIAKEPAPPAAPTSPPPSTPPSTPAESESPLELPDVSGRLVLRNSRGTFEDVVDRRVTRFDMENAELSGRLSSSPGSVAFSAKGGLSNVNVSQSENATTASPILQKLSAELDVLGQFNAKVGVQFSRLLLKDNQGLFSLTKSDETLVIPTDAKTQPSGEVVLDADLKRIDDLVRSLQSDPAGGRILAGAASARLSVSRDGEVVVLTPRISTKGLTLGGDAVKKPADLNVSGEVRLNTPAEEITVTQLDISGPGSTLKLDRPLVMKGSGATQTVSAALSGRINLPELLTTLEAWNGAAAGSMYPYAGDVVIRQELATSPGGAIALTGGADVNNFAMTGEGAAKFDERLIKLSHTVQYDPAAKAVKIDNVALAMESSKAVTMTMTGGVRELDTTRRIDNLILKLDYDAKILWDLLRPILDPETAGKSLEEITLGGKRSQMIEISGSFPANDPHAIRNIRATGGFGLESLAMRGLAVAQLDLKFLLEGGVLRFEHTNAPPSEKLPPGSPCNGTGQISFHNIVVNMTGDHPRLVIPDGHPLIHDVSINPALADTLLARFVNPAFKDATQARGLLNVTVVKCPNLALGEAMQSTNASETGRAELTWSLTDLFLGQPELVAFVSKLKPNALNEDGFSGNIKNGRIIIEAGRVQNDMEFSVDKYGLRFDGGIGLAENTLIDFSVTLPKALFDEIDDNLGKHARPEGYRVALTGTTDNGLASAQNSILPIIADLGVKAGLGSLLERAVGGDKKSGGNETAVPAKPEDLLNQLLDRETDEEKEARRAKNRAEREKKEQAARQAKQETATQPTSSPAEPELTKKERERLKKEQQRLENQRKREEAEKRREEKKKQRDAK